MRLSNRRRLVSNLVLAAAATAWVAPHASRADDRRFGFVEMTDTLLKGGLETEQWFTWQTKTRDDSGFNKYIFKHELEYGITNELQLGVDALVWHIQTGQEKDGPRFDEVAAELKYRFTDPHTDLVGVAAKLEVGGGDRHVGVEGKVIVDKYIDKWLPAYNLVLEAEWGGPDFEDHEGEIVQSAGVSYEVTTGLFLGVELLHEIPLPDWQASEKSNFFMGPNISYHRGAYESGNWAITVTPLIRVSGGDEEPALQVRILFELDF